MIGRSAFAYVVAIEGNQVTLNLKDEHRGYMAAHRQGLVSVTDTGSLFGVDSAGTLLVMRVRSLSFAEPREAHRAGVGTTSMAGDPLRHVVASVVGFIARRDGRLSFVPDALTSPTLGAEAYPLSDQELAAVLNLAAGIDQPITLGESTRGGGALTVSVPDLLGRHMAVLGSTGQGKSCFTAAILQQLLKYDRPRIIVFDINGEYGPALRPHLDKSKVKETVIGGPDSTFKIPYYALGRHGLGRLLLPSEKTQRPALNFALDALCHVCCIGNQNGVGLVGDLTASLFDDCRSNDALAAHNTIEKLRAGGLPQANEWPPMRALATLVAESHAIKLDNRGAWTRGAFEYGNVSPLITLIWRFTEDPMFKAVVEVSGGKPRVEGGLNWQAEGQRLVEDIFGGDTNDWHLHVVNLRNVAHDLMPMVLGALLELLAFELFRRGPGKTHPTLLVLEEAHHYLRPVGEREDGGRSLAYERLAKEGRKFGLSLWLSTQRPSEMSSTVLAQCGTWAVFRLSSESDQSAVSAATEWADKKEISQIAGLRRQQAMVFGASVALPTRIVAAEANPVPTSKDPSFEAWGRPRPWPPPPGEVTPA